MNQINPHHQALINLTDDLLLNGTFVFAAPVALRKIIELKNMGVYCAMLDRHTIKLIATKL